MRKEGAAGEGLKTYGEIQCLLRSSAVIFIILNIYFSILTNNFKVDIFLTYTYTQITLSFPIILAILHTGRGSAATALICAAASIQATTNQPFLGITSNLYVLGYVSSLATKLSDTFASEIGKAYGKTTFLITTLERVEPGTEGAVSAEGTAAALFGGSLLPFYALAIGLLPNLGSVGIVTIAAFLATNAESVIGATLQGKKGLEWITNEVVNFFNTVIGAGIAIVSGMLLFGV